MSGHHDGVGGRSPLAAALSTALAESNLEGALHAARTHHMRDPSHPTAKRVVEALELLMNEVWIGSEDPDPRYGDARGYLKLAALTDADEIYAEILATHPDAGLARRLFTRTRVVLAAAEDAPLPAPEPQAPLRVPEEVQHVFEQSTRVAGVGELPLSAFEEDEVTSGLANQAVPAEAFPPPMFGDHIMKDVAPEYADEPTRTLEAGEFELVDEAPVTMAQVAAAIAPPAARPVPPPPAPRAEPPTWATQESSVPDEMDDETGAERPTAAGGSLMARMVAGDPEIVSMTAPPAPPGPPAGAPGDPMGAAAGFAPPPATPPRPAIPAAPARPARELGPAPTGPPDAFAATAPPVPPFAGAPHSTPPTPNHPSQAPQPASLSTPQPTQPASPAAPPAPTAPPFQASAPPFQAPPFQQPSGAPPFHGSSPAPIAPFQASSSPPPFQAAPATAAPLPDAPTAPAGPPFQVSSPAPPFQSAASPAPRAPFEAYSPAPSSTDPSVDRTAELPATSLADVSAASYAGYPSMGPEASSGRRVAVTAPMMPSVMMPPMAPPPAPHAPRFDPDAFAGFQPSISIEYEPSVPGSSEPAFDFDDDTPPSDTPIDYGGDGQWDDQPTSQAAAYTDPPSVPAPPAPVAPSGPPPAPAAALDPAEAEAEACLQAGALDEALARYHDLAARFPSQSRYWAKVNEIHRRKQGK